MSDKDLRKLSAQVDTMYLGILRRLETSENIMSRLVEDLKLEVAKNREVTSSAVQLMSSLMARIQVPVDNRDLEGIQEILDEVRADTKVLGDAIAANTVAADEIKPDPAPATNTPPVSSPEEQLGDQPVPTPPEQLSPEQTPTVDPVSIPNSQPPDTSGREPDRG